MSKNPLQRYKPTSQQILQDRVAKQKAARLEREKPQPPPRPILTEFRRVLDLNDFLPFDKHKGRTVQEVIETDIGWLTWIMEESPNFELSDDAMAEYSDHFASRRTRRK